MLTTKQNLLETIHGGHPDRFVNQYEAFKMVFDPIMGQSPMAAYGEAPVVPGALPTCGRKARRVLFPFIPRTKL